MIKVSIYSANLAPIIDEEGREVYVIKAKTERFHSYIKELKSIIKEVLRNEEVRSMVANVGSIEGLTKLLKLINDLIVIYFKRLFTIPVLPPTRERTEEYVLEHSDLLYSHLIAKDLGLPILPEEDLVSVDYEVLTNFIDSTLSKLGVRVRTKLFSIKSPKAVLKDFIDIVMGIPADTRPGLNISKLVPHMLLTSAIASVKYISKHGNAGKGLSIEDRLHLEILRLTSLLHDIGKPLSWLFNISHAKASAMLVSDLVNELRNFLKGEGITNYLRVLRELITELIEKHHRPNEVTEHYELLNVSINARELAKLLAEADRDASASDRLLDKVIPIITKSELIKSKGYSEEEVRRALTKVGTEAWSFWRSFTDEEIRRLSEEVVRELSKSPITHVTPNEVVKVRNVKVVSIDVRGIQSFIRRESLKGVVAASTLVNILTLYSIPKALIDALNIPPEAVIFSGGGSVISLIPNWATEDLLEGVFKSIKLGVNIGFTYAVADLMIPWILTQRSLASKLNAKKLTLGADKVRYSINDLILGNEVICDSCRRRPATKVSKYLGYVCDECLKIHEFGKGMYVKYKLDLLKRLGYDVSVYSNEVSKIYNYLMNWLSGAKEYDRVGRYLAIVKIDGNSVGSYMAYALTPTEAYLRSLRIDLGTKLGVYTFLKELLELNIAEGNSIHELSSEELIVRVFAGLMYVGGDDLLAIIPSSTSIPLALSVAYWFWRLTGTRTVSVGLACGKPKHNVWVLIDVANKLLKESKKVCRRDLVSNVKSKLMYIHFELGTQQLLPSTIDEVKRVYGGSGLFREPYTLPQVSGEVCRNSLINLLKLLISKLEDPSLNLKREDVYKELIKEVLSLRASVVKDVRSVAKEVLTSITTMMSELSKEDIYLKLITKLTWLSTRPTKVNYIYRAIAREALNEYSRFRTMELPPLRDLLVLTNILLGGGA